MSLRTILAGSAPIVILLAIPAAMSGQQGPGAPGQYSGPSVLSRWSRQEGGGQAAPTSLRGFLHTSYSFLNGLSGPINDVAVSSRPEASHNVMGGGGLVLTHLDSRSSLSLDYRANYTRAFSDSTQAYRGLNQDLNLTYERQMSRRWGFYTGHTAGNQNTILGLSRPITQRNFFDQTYSASSEALDARLKYLNSGAGLFFQKSSRLMVSADGGVFTVSRQSQALASSRGERAQGEVAYRTSRRQSIGLIYSYSHFFFPRGFGESFIHTAMLSYTRQIGRYWSLSASAGPYRSESERLRQIAVDPYIARLTGQTSTVEVFRGKQTGFTTNTNLSGRYGRHSTLIGYRRAVDPGNGITLTALTDMAQVNYSYQTRRDLALGWSLFALRMDPILQGTDRNALFRSEGGNFTASYRITSYVHVLGNAGLHSVRYQQFGFRQNRKTASIGLAFSPAVLPLHR